MLESRDLEPLKDFLDAIKPWPAVFDPQYVKKLNGPNVKKGKSKRDLAEQVMADIERFKKEKGCDRLVMVWCGSTEVYRQPSEVHQTLAAFEKGLDESHPDIPPSMIYAYARSRRASPTATARRTSRPTSRRCSSWRRRRARRSAARTSRPARPS